MPSLTPTRWRISIMCPDGEEPAFVADKVGVEGADGTVLNALSHNQNHLDLEMYRAV
jgi:hypothetical protein